MTEMNTEAEIFIHADPTSLEPNRGPYEFKGLAEDTNLDAKGIPKQHIEELRSSGGHSGGLHTPSNHNRPTDEVLTNFGPRVPTRKPRVRVEREGKWRESTHISTLNQLRDLTRKELPVWHRLPFFGGYRLPGTSELLNLAWHFYPPRAKLKAYVYDIYSDHSEQTEIFVGNIENYWHEKPAGVVVRWIHAPIGLGFYHSTLEDLFRDVHVMGQPFKTAGSSQWPYVEIDCLNFRHTENIRDLRDAYCLLSGLDHLQDLLNKSVFDGDENPKVRQDLEWRVKHFDTSIEYWDTVASSMPHMLSDGLPVHTQGPLSRIKPSLGSRDFKILSQHPRFLDAQLVRNEFRFFHRADGFLLTMSAASGVNYLDSRLNEYIHEPTESILPSPEASVVGHVMKEFAANGTGGPTSWHMATVEWFLIYLITELGVAPHSSRLGHNTQGIMEAYQEILRDLRHRVFDPWKRGETVALTRTFLQCTEEVEIINKLLHRKYDFFLRLKADCEIFAQQDQEAGVVPNNPQGKSSVDRVEWAMSSLRQQISDSAYVLQELNQSIQTLVQIRTIEQNELAIIRDGQDRAIRLVTVVTTVFLPLSFCTSYFGMNLEGIVGTSRSESYFWYVCGTIGLGIIIIICGFALRHRIRQYLLIKKFEFAA